MESKGLVLVTRPEPGAAETAARLEAMGWEPVVAPALVLTSRAFAVPRGVQAVLLPSRASARALPDEALHLPILAVGEATGEEARARGASQVMAAEGTAESLAALVAARLDPRAGPLLIAAGQGYGLNLARMVRAHGFSALRRIAYVATPARALPDETVARLLHGKVVAVLFYSPRTVRCAISLLRSAGLLATVAQGVALALSPRVAEEAAAAIAPLAWRALRTARRPDQKSLLALLGELSPARAIGASPAGDA